MICGASGADPTSLTVQLVKVQDPAGLAPAVDALGNPTVIAGQVSFPACAPGLTQITNPLTVTVPTSAAPGRYAVMVTSIARQVWRVPNELQPALMDASARDATPTAAMALLQTQQVAVNIVP